MEIGMNLPVMAPGLDRDTFLNWCERIDAGFFASIAAGERISFYNPDMTAALAAAAVLTERVKIISGVFVPMLHHPVMLAKQLATIDVLSAGASLRASASAGGSRTTSPSMPRSASASPGSPKASKRCVASGAANRSSRAPFPWARRPSRKADRSFSPARSWWSRSKSRRSGPTDSAVSALAHPLPRWSCSSKPRDARGKSAAGPSHGSERASGTRSVPNAREQLDAYLDRYLNFMAPVARENVKQICIATTPQALKDAVQQAKDAGADDVLLVPTTSDPDDVHRVTDILG